MRGKAPRKALGRDAHGDARDGKCIDFRLDAEVAAVKEAKPEHFAGVLGCAGAFQGHKRVFVVGGIAAQAVNRRDAGGKGPCVEVAFARPGAGQLEPFIIAVGQIERKAHRRLDLHGGLPLIRKAGAAGDGGIPRKNRVEELQAQAGHGVAQNDRERFRLLGVFDVRGRQALEGGLSLADYEALVAKVHDAAAVFLADGERRVAEIGAAAGRILLADLLEGKRRVLPRRIGAHRARGALAQIRKIRLVVQAAPAIELAQLPVFEHAEEIADVFVVKMERFRLFVKDNIDHWKFPFFAMLEPRGPASEFLSSIRQERNGRDCVLF